MAAGMQTETKRKESPPDTHHGTHDRTVARGSHSQTEQAPASIVNSPCFRFLLNRSQCFLIDH